jgi:hypothetical protein
MRQSRTTSTIRTSKNAARNCLMCLADSFVLGTRGDTIGVDFAENMEISTLDFGTFHVRMRSSLADYRALTNRSVQMYPVCARVPPLLFCASDTLSFIYSG